ncbi:MAG: hypothetical protein QOJ52_2949 [Acidimicrobiaceae bacterium]|nr:hypothetical protein [Acidimicrobiaceae bacterium]MDQ1420987.1 hypothetical protein [Acidimicrobiaceae bacterium]MDQ1442359.1 hypothetical protein [Acidimicrobiaceae bacterium]
MWAEAAGTAAAADDAEARETVVLVVSELTLAVPDEVSDAAPVADVAATVLDVEWLPAMTVASPATPTTLATPVTMRAPRAG